MFNWRKKSISITIIAILIVGLCFLGVNGNGQNGDVKPNIPATTLREPEEEVVEPEQKQTDLTVLLIDNINGSNIRLRNCIVQLVGEMQIAEDIFTYNNTFYDGNIYKITVLIELKDTEQK